MPRINLPEFEDQRWFPKILRNMLTDYLQFMYKKSGVFQPIIPILKRALSETGANVLVDLCSGAGGPVPYLQRCLEDEGVTIDAILTDKFPNVKAFNELEINTNGRIKFVTDAIDASDVPDNLKGFRTIFTGFHHLSPNMARTVLANAVQGRQGIGVFEVNERRIMAFIFNIFTPIFVLISTPFIRPFTWYRILFTYLPPVLPLVTMWDGIASNFRTYSLRELRHMTNEIGVDPVSYTWEMGKIPSRGGRRITYLLGLPKGF